MTSTALRTFNKNIVVIDNQIVHRYAGGGFRILPISRLLKKNPNYDISKFAVVTTGRRLTDNLLLQGLLDSYPSSPSESMLDFVYAVNNNLINTNRPYYENINLTTNI